MKDRKQIVLLPQVFQWKRQLDGQPFTEPVISAAVFICRQGRGDWKKVAFPLIAMATRRAIAGRLFRSVPRSTAPGASCDSIGSWPGESTNAPPNRTSNSSRASSYHNRGPHPVRLRTRRRARGVVNLGSPPEVISRLDLVGIVRTTRDRFGEVLAVGDNLDDLNPAADYYLAQANAKYEARAAADRTYAGIVPILLDGAVQQVTWSVGGGVPRPHAPAATPSTPRTCRASRRSAASRRSRPSSRATSSCSRRAAPAAAAKRRSRAAFRPRTLPRPG